MERFFSIIGKGKEKALWHNAREYDIRNVEVSYQLSILFGRKADTREIPMIWRVLSICDYETNLQLLVGNRKYRTDLQVSRDFFTLHR